MPTTGQTADSASKNESGAGSPLTGLRVLDFSEDTAGSFCTQLLADLGADVIKIVDVKAAGQQQLSDPDFFYAYQRNKRILQLDLSSNEGRRAALDLVAKSDAVVDSLFEKEAEAAGRSLEQLRSANPQIIFCRLSPFGQSGPLGGKRASDLSIQALSGAMGITGEPDRPPVTMGISLGDQISGLIGAITVLAKAEQRERTGKGATADIAAFDANIAMLSYMTNIYFATGEVPKKLGSSHPTIFPYNAFKTKDSYIVAAPFTQIFWRKLCAVIGRNDLPDNPDYRNFVERLKNRPALSKIIDDAFLEHTTAEWREKLSKGDVPNGPVNSIGDALEMEQTAARQMVVSVAKPAGEGHVRMVGTPFHFDYEGRASFTPSYRLPESVKLDAIGWDKRTNATKSAPENVDQPLQGLRVLDLTRMFAGPYCCLFMADLGAEVIKIEEPKIGDPTRRNIPQVNGESTYFMAVNRGKKSMVLDLKNPDHREIFLKLVAKSDIVVENYRPGVMDRLGLSYAELRARKSDIIVLSISGFGQTGPMRDGISFDIVNQAMAGVMSVTGEAGRPPVRIGVPLGDLNGGIFGAFALLAALRARRVTGRGAAIDLSLHDLILGLLGRLGQAFLNSGISPEKRGSSDSKVVPSRAYEANDGWIAITAATDREWTALTKSLALDIGADPRFATAAGRLAHRQDVDASIERAVGKLSVVQSLERLKEHGVDAVPVCSLGEAVDSAQAAARGMVLTYDHPSAGRCRGVGTAIVADSTLLTAPLPPPTLGQHTDYVLRDILGLEAGSTARKENAAAK